MRLIYHGGYSERDREQFKEAIFSNTVQSMQVILDAIETLGLTLGGEEASSHAGTIMSQPPVIEGGRLPPDVTRAIVVLWRNSTVQECYGRSNEYQLNDSAK